MPRNQPQNLPPNGTAVRAKLFRPTVRPQLLPRPHLYRQLDAGLSGPLTLVCAGAGFGKTTLVSAWLAELGIPNAWLSLDERDADVATFARYVVAALRTLHPEACATTLEMASSATPPGPAELAATLGNELSQLPGRIVLALDDYHTLRGVAVHELVADLLRHWPPTLHLVLITRHTPPLPVAVLRARGQLTEIRSRDLRFSRAEVAEVLRMALGVPLSDFALARLEAHTEGWITGVQLAALSLKETGDADRFVVELGGADAKVADYLVDEILAQQPPGVQTFLLRIAPLHRFCADLCEAVAVPPGGAGEVRAHMDWMLRTNLFVVALDADGIWFRLHHLFQDVLERRLLAHEPASEIRALHHRAAGWWSAAGEPDEALRHALVAGDLDVAAEVVEAGLLAVLNSEDRRSLERRLAALPAELVERRPWLQVGRAWSLGYTLQPQALARTVDRVRALLADAGAAVPGPAEGYDRTVLEGNLEAIASHLAVLTNRNAAAIAHSQRALEQLPPAWSYARGVAMLHLGLAMQAEGQGRAAEERLMAEYQASHEREGVYGTRLLFTLGFIHLQSADLPAAAAAAERMLRQAEAGGFGMLINWARFILGTVHYQRDDLLSAEDAFGQILAHAYTANELTVREGLVGLTLVALASGHGDRAWECVDRLASLDLTDRGQESAWTGALRARVQMGQGDLAAAGRWADGYTELPDTSLHWLLAAPLVRAQVLLARGRAADLRAALATLDGLMALVRRTHNTRYQVAVGAALGLAHHLAGDEGSALAELRAALALARPGGLRRAFLDLGPKLRPLLVDLIAAQPDNRAACDLLDAFAASGRPATAPPVRAGANQALIEPLTPRELETLAFLAEPMGGREIAEKLGVTLATFKRHTSNIYGKLGVTRRWDAVASAREAGLLPPH